MRLRRDAEEFVMPTKGELWFWFSTPMSKAYRKWAADPNRSRPEYAGFNMTWEYLLDMRWSCQNCRAVCDWASCSEELEWGGVRDHATSPTIRCPWCFADQFKPEDLATIRAMARMVGEDPPDPFAENSSSALMFFSVLVDLGSWKSRGDDTLGRLVRARAARFPSLAEDR